MAKVRDMKVFADSPFCPYCAAEGPVLTGDQRNFKCKECSEAWRIKRGATQADTLHLLSDTEDRDD
jgi:tRNA(Ile2) C34 agmatinyltransferase TiaS